MSNPKFIPTTWTLEGSIDSEYPPITIEQCRQRDDGVKFAVRQGAACLKKTGKWEYEPMPSSRTDAFLNRCRFDSFGLAVEAVKRYVESPKGRFQ